MLSVSTTRNSALKEILSFTYPRLHTGLCWFISFYAFDPAKGAMRRKRIKINSVGTSAEKRRYAAQVCHRLSAKLETGWNPWVEAEADYSYKLFADALNQYRTYINKQLNDEVLRKSTIHGYMSSAGILERWNNESPAPIGYVYQFDRSFCVRFLDYVYLGREIRLLLETIISLFFAPSLPSWFSTYTLRKSQPKGFKGWARVSGLRGGQWSSRQICGVYMIAPWPSAGKTDYSTDFIKPLLNGVLGSTPRSVCFVRILRARFTSAIARHSQLCAWISAGSTDTWSAVRVFFPAAKHLYGFPGH